MGAGESNFKDYLEKNPIRGTKIVEYDQKKDKMVLSIEREGCPYDSITIFPMEHAVVQRTRFVLSIKNIKLPDGFEITKTIDSTTPINIYVELGLIILS